MCMVCSRWPVYTWGRRSTLGWVSIQHVEMYVYGVFPVASVHVGSDVYPGVSEHTASVLEEFFFPSILGRVLCSWTSWQNSCRGNGRHIHWQNPSLKRRHIYRYYFGRRWRPRPCQRPCPRRPVYRNFVIIGPNNSKLGMHASGNDSKCSAQEP